VARRLRRAVEKAAGLVSGGFFAFLPFGTVMRLSRMADKMALISPRTYISKERT